MCYCTFGRFRDSSALSQHHLHPRFTTFDIAFGTYCWKSFLIFYRYWVRLSVSEGFIFTMASPPYHHPSLSASSPPYSSNSQLPQPPKRRQSDMASSGPPIKRRKPSLMSATSNSSHPLRQTSFPPENIDSQIPRYSRSPSVDTMSLASGVSGAKRKRGSYKKSKGKGDDESMIGGTTKSAVSGNSGQGGPRKRRKSRDESVEEEDVGGDDLALETVQRTEEEKQKDVERRAMLTQLFDDDQWDRFGAWRAARLSDAVVRRVRSFSIMVIWPRLMVLDYQPDAVAVCTSQCHGRHQSCCKGLCRRSHRECEEGTSSMGCCR